MRNATLTFLLRDEQVNLPRKKRGFGINRHNGYGGKQHDGESVEEAVIRELIEESSIYAEKSDLIKCAELEFTFPEKPEWNQRVHVYLLERWTGEPEETSEMRPHWFHRSQIPYAQMWPDDPFWLPHILERKYLTAEFSLSIDQNTILNQKVNLFDENPFY